MQIPQELKYYIQNYYLCCFLLRPQMSHGWQELVVLFFLLVLFYSLHPVLNQHKLILKVYHVINTNNIHVKGMSE